MVETCFIEGLFIVMPKKFCDDRGFFSETYNRQALAEAGFDKEFVQDNHSLSREVGVLRGLHFQSPPYAQDKLVRVLKGAIFDVAVDLRRSSPTYGKHFAIELSADNWLQLLVPIGFAHGFCTLVPDTEVSYKVTNRYAPENDSGLIWNDADLAINWPLTTPPVLSSKDASLPRFCDFDSPF
ncbi:dTDP-4-dehydrorhamnose 3,5-epimerase [Roseibium sediminis]|uniref:dTDP-4-dehydrorhamnose 3,5-epimerase n=1 Tax=Roseibium sediminis TaxID=1775174 RepID=UPI00123C9BDC|nr:dTDP-4-dehydrorhamnose 3,5-epimerase [Roseibium sediminis]